jgi:hypothetical protein
MTPLYFAQGRGPEAVVNISIDRCQGAGAECARDGFLQGMPRTTRTYTVSADGKAMSETIVWLNINGNPEITTNQFNGAP